jgi:ATP-dependent Lhr-like helicase
MITESGASSGRFHRAATEIVFDTMEHSERLRDKHSLGGHSLATVRERELGASIDKRQQTSNWSRRPLDADQLRYAALDAEVLLGLYERFVADHVTTGPEGRDA